MASIYKAILIAIIEYIFSSKNPKKEKKVGSTCYKYKLQLSRFFNVRHNN